ncbi:MAG: chemotaxis-specific protein-glutamate methyltransferase CheB [Treponema sp.]|jgi:two-component system chemotaxis response regulator CheB|nr:chemotaxis-specific protein-glutamate methyltransferase CheB [Treponema sp.]
MINTLIVDDSALARDILRDFLEGDGNFKIIGEAVDGEDGVQKILSLNPDLVTLDLEMPKMNGLEVIETVMKQTSVPIVVVTSHDTAKNAYEATVKGALEFYPKDTFSASLTPERQKEIYETLKRISGVKAAWKKNGEAAPLAIESAAADAVTASLQNRIVEKRKIDAVVLASSTGGPKALSSFFPLVPSDFPVPIVIVQHNSSGFVKSFAQWLGAYTALKVKLAEEGETPKPGTVYIAQTDKHLELRLTDVGQMILRYNDDEPENNQKPAADVLFRTAAESLKQSVISVVLTGMGSDGAAGTRKIREMGGITLAQDEGSSLIYGMPKAAAETGCVDIVMPLDMIPAELARLTQ